MGEDEGRDLGWGTALRRDGQPLQKQAMVRRKASRRSWTRR